MAFLGNQIQKFPDHAVDFGPLNLDNDPKVERFQHSREIQMQTQLSIPTSRIPELAVQITKFNRRAIKLGLTANCLVMKFGAPECRTLALEDNRKVVVEYTPVTITGEMPVLNGWKLVSKLDHLTATDVIIRSISDITCPDVYHTSGPVCEHCNTKRNSRKSTYVLFNSETNTFKQVGSTCLKDFIPTSITSELSYLTSYFNLFKTIDDDGFDSYGSNDFRVGTQEAFAAVIRIIHSYGFVPSKSEDCTSTKLELETYFFGTPKACKMLVDGLTLSHDDASVKYQLVHDWIENSSNTSEFFMNIKTLLKLDYCHPKYFGYIAGAVAQYNKEMDNRISQKIQFNDSYPDFALKSRVIFKDVKVLNVKATDGYYGTTYINKMVDSDNHQLIWFTTSDSLEVSDEPISFKATIKNYNEYNGIKQTVLSRVTLI